MPEAWDMLPTKKRRREILEYRKKGKKIEWIRDKMLERWGGKKLPSGWDERYVSKDIKRALRQWRKEYREDRNAYVQLELQRLDDLLSRLYEQLEFKFSHATVDRILKVMERRAKYLGLDDPEKIAFTNTEGEDIGFTWADPDDAPEWKDVEVKDESGEVKKIKPSDNGMSENGSHNED
jgi:hypothetical protein